MNFIGGEVEAEVDGQAVRVTFKPIGGILCEEEDPARCEFAEGLPIVDVARLDGQPLRMDQEVSARATATQACDQNANWNLSKFTYEGEQFADRRLIRRAASSKGNSFLVDGVWIFFALCE